MDADGARKSAQGAATKIAWRGTVISVQPRIGLLRSFDQRHHSYLGYVLRLHGAIGVEEREFSVAIGEAAQVKHQFRVGDVVNGEGVPVADPRAETAELYKASKMRVEARSSEPTLSPPPWHTLAISLSEYRRRGHRRLDARTYGTKCSACVWGCRMPVEMIIDQWNPSVKRFAPVPPDAGKHDPYETVAFLQADPGSRALQDIELVAQSEVLKGEALSGSKSRAEQV